MKIIEFMKIIEDKHFIPTQITIFTTTSTDIETINDKLHKYNVDNSTTYEIKSKINGKYVKVTTNYLDEEIIELLEFKSQNIEKNYEDSIIEKSMKIRSNQRKKSHPATNTIVNKLLNLNNLRKRHPKINSIESAIQIEKITKRIINTNGLDIETTNFVNAIYVEVTGKDNESISNINDLKYTDNIEKENLEQLTENLIEKVEISLKKEVVKSGTYSAILSQDFMSKMLSQAISLFSKENVRIGTSCLEDKIGKQIFSKKLTIIENPLKKEYPSYTKFDNEGTLTCQKKIIENGVLTTYLYNTKEAILDKKLSTGNGYGKINVRNMYIKPGRATFNKLLEKMQNGLYINKYMETGGTVLNLSTGEISVQVFGFIVENGKITKGLESCILTTNIFDLFTNIKLIGNDLDFKTINVGSPSILVENVSISSN